MKTAIKDKVILLSKKGIKELKKAVAQLEREKQKAMQMLRDIDKTFSREGRLDRIEKLFNVDCIESELAEKKMLLSTAHVIPSKRRTRFKVNLGSVVDLIDAHGRLFRYTLVDSVEANPSDGRISTLSPLGKSLMGKTVKDIIEWHRGNKINYFQLIGIS